MLLDLQHYLVLHIKIYFYREDWSHAFYLGKICEKLGCSHDTSLSYYAKAIALNPSAVDPFYRMHASRLKLLCTCGKQDQEAMKVFPSWFFLAVIFEFSPILFSTPQKTIFYSTERTKMCNIEGAEYKLSLVH